MNSEFRSWLVSWSKSSPGPYLNSSWHIINWTTGNKPKEKQKNFQKMKQNYKMSSTKWQSFCIAATLTGGVYLPVHVVTLHNSSLAQLGRAWPPNLGPISLTTFPSGPNPPLVQLMACRLIDAEPLPEPMLGMVTSRKQCLWNFNRKQYLFQSRKCISTCRLQSGDHFVSASNMVTEAIMIYHE